MAIEGVNNAATKATVEPTEAAQAVSASVSVTSKAVNANDTATVAESMEAFKEGEDARKQVAKSTVRNTVSHANSIMERTRCEFSYHEATHRVSIKVVDKDTEEVIKEIPPEESLEMLEKMWEMAGLLVDERR